MSTYLRNGKLQAAPWWHSYSPMKLVHLIVFFFQTLLAGSPDAADAIRARKGKASDGRAPKRPMGRLPGTGGSNVQTLNMRDCGAGG